MLYDIVISIPFFVFFSLFFESQISAKQNQHCQQNGTSARVLVRYHQKLNETDFKMRPMVSEILVFFYCAGISFHIFSLDDIGGYKLSGTLQPCQYELFLLLLLSTLHTYVINEWMRLKRSAGP